MTAFVNHFAFEFKTGLRNSNLMLLNYLFPLAFYAMMGIVMVQINPGFSDVLIPAMVLFAVMASNILGLPNPLVESREAGIYRSYKINGVPAISILTIPALTTIFHALIASTIIALTATPLFSSLPPTDWLNFAVITLLSAFTFGGLGALIGVIAANSRAVVLWSQLIFLPSMLLGGLMISLETLPESVQSFAKLLPTTYAMQAYQGYAYGLETIIDPATSMIILAASAIISFVLAIYLFSWDRQNSARRGSPLLALLSLLPYIAGVIFA